MYHTKRLENCGPVFLAYQSTWLVPETIRFRELTICERAVLVPPEGKFLTLTVNGIGKEIKDGAYKGDVVLSVTDAYDMEPGGLMRFNRIGRLMHSAVVVRDGRVEKDKCVPDIILGGEVADAKTEGVYIASEEECFNGIIVAGDGEYTVKDVKVDFEGFGDNDFLGVGCAVTAVDNAKVAIDGCDFTFNGVTRCAVHVGGKSDVLVKDTKITNLSPHSEWTGSFSWQVGFNGTNRLAQLTDGASVVYDNCDLKTNGWGILSIDGNDDPVSMLVKNSRLELSGPRAHGYGAFCIGENEITFDNCDVDVNGYPMLLMGMEGDGRVLLKNCRIKGRRFGAMVVSDDNSILNIEGTDFTTGKSTLCIKGSATTINLDRVSAKAGNGTIVQLMDTDEGGMNSMEYFIPVGEVDEAVPGRDLATVSATEDVCMTISNSRLEGDFFNSTSSIRAFERSARGGMGKFHDTLIGHLSMPEGAVSVEQMSPVAARHNGDDLKGAKNLGLALVNTQIEGVISSAAQAYREGLKVIYEDNRLELSNVTQTAAPTVNNGVVLELDKASSWIVTGTSYITALRIAEGAIVKAVDGKALTMLIDGKETAIAPGAYSGSIVMKVN